VKQRNPFQNNSIFSPKSVPDLFVWSGKYVAESFGEFKKKTKKKQTNKKIYTRYYYFSATSKWGKRHRYRNRTSRGECSQRSHAAMNFKNIYFVSSWFPTAYSIYFVSVRCFCSSGSPKRFQSEHTEPRVSIVERSYNGALFAVNILYYNH